MAVYSGMSSGTPPQYMRVTAEMCDDGNTINRDGCTASVLGDPNSGCSVEDGWNCVYDWSQGRSVCTTNCGDGLLGGAEECDDGNVLDGDGCSHDCIVDPNYCPGCCGNGQIQVSRGEQCDDRNTFSGDGCDELCQLETGWRCIYGGVPCVSICNDGLIVGLETCEDGNTVSGDGCSSTCQLERGWYCAVGGPCSSRCSDGIIAGNEQCDDGQNPPQNGNGCSASCAIEPGYSCTGEPSQCTYSCGNRSIDLGEQCDDGNTVSGDGCSNVCQMESGYICTGMPSVCSPVCGDGVITPTEQCDDHNSVPSDGCSAFCQFEPGWTCTGTPSVCEQTCGNGAVTAGEQCDDRNMTSGDGCSNTCQRETGWTCSGAPSACRTTCGDGIRAGTEQCDDRNTVDGDGCSGLCRVELPPSLQAQVEGTPSARPGSSFSLNYRLRNTGGKAINWKLRIPLNQVALDQEQHLDISTTQPASCVRTYDNWNHIPAADCTFTLDTDAQISFFVNFQVAANAPCTTLRTYTVQYFNAAGQTQTGPALAGTLQANCASSSSSVSTGPVPAFQAQVTGTPSGLPGTTIPLTFRFRNTGGRAENWKLRIPLNQGGPLDVSTTQPPNCVRTFDGWNQIPAVECSFTLEADAIANFPVNFEAAPTAPCNTSRTYALQYFNPAGQPQSAGHQQLAGTLSVTCPVSTSSSSSSSSSAIPPCTDSDNGLNYTSRGCASGGINLCDFCSGTKNLIEVYCRDGWEVDYVNWVCTGTCQEGMCIGASSASSLSDASSSAISALSLSSSAASAFPLCGNSRLETGEQCDRGAAACPAGWSCDYSSCLCLPLPPILPASSNPSSARTSSAANALICGNGLLDPGEQCERNYSCLSPAHYCSTSCQCLALPGSSLSSASISNSSVVSFAYSSSSLPLSVCGNRIFEQGEECEIGVVCPPDAVCNSACLCMNIAPSFSASSSVLSEEEMSSSTASSASTVCGNGLTEQGEECDDQNLIDGDGCSSLCALDPGYACIGQPLLCLPVCGDGIRLASEECDDGNVRDGDGCSSVCTSEHAAPPVEPPPPHVCGDGLLIPPEECDDGNMTNGDGCSTTCMLEIFSSSSIASADDSSSSSLSTISDEQSSVSSIILQPIPPQQPESNFFLWLIIGVGSLLIFLILFLLLRTRKGSEE